MILARVFLKYAESYAGVGAQHQSTSQQLANTAAKDDFFAKLEDKYMAQEPPMTTDSFLTSIIEYEVQK